MCLVCSLCMIDSHLVLFLLRNSCLMVCWQPTVLRAERLSSELMLVPFECTLQMYVFLETTVG